MKEQSKNIKSSYQDITNDINNILKISKNSRILHASQQRTKYSNILQWFDLSLSTLLKNKNISHLQMCQKQKQIVLACLGEMIQMARKQCVEKSLILSMILEYVINTLNSYWQTYQNTNRQLKYDYEHNTVKFEQQFLSKIKQITIENQQLKKDKQHRWRNAYMLIKDNRIHRKQNKKLLKSMNQQIQKNINLAQQLITIRQQNEKLKIKLSVFQKSEVQLWQFIETQTCLQELKKKLKIYPRKIKKLLKDQLIKIEINQINNLQNKIQFIIKAMEQTGEIIDQYYDEYLGNIHFHYNISTQTDNPTEEKACNTPSIKQNNFEFNVKPYDIIKLNLEQAFSLRIKPIKFDKEPESKSMNSTMNLSKKISMMKKQQFKHKFNQKKVIINDHLTICQSLKLTIKQNKFSYVSTHNNQIIYDYYSKTDTCSKNKQNKMLLPTRKSVNQIQVQTQEQPPQNNQDIRASRMLNQSYSQNNSQLMKMSLTKLKPYIKYTQLNYNREVNYHYRPQAKRIIKLKRHTFTIFNKKIQTQVLIPILNDLSVINKPKLQMSQEQQLQKIQQVKKALIERKHFKSNFNKKNVIKADNLINKNMNIDQQQISKQESQKIILQDNTLVHEKQYFMNNIAKNANKGGEFMRTLQFSNKKSQYPNISINYIQKASVQASEKNNHAIIMYEEKKRSSNAPTTMMNLTKIHQNHQRYNSSSALPNQIGSNDYITKISKLSSSKKFRTSKRTSTQISEHLLAPKYNTTNNNRTIYNVKKTSNFNNTTNLAFNQLNLVQSKQNFKQKDVNISMREYPKEKNSIIKESDFMKILEKMLNNMNLRYKEVINHQYELKTFLIAYFKQQYSKDLYSSFVDHIKNSHQEIHIFLLKLLNNHLPSNYLQDIFKTFALVINKTYQLGHNPLSQHIPIEILQYLLSFYLEEHKIYDFKSKIKTLNIYSIFSWFICLQQQLKTNCIQTQIYKFLSQFSHPFQKITYEFMEEITYFLTYNKIDNNKLFHYKVLCGQEGIQLYKACLFCYKYQWSSLLNIKYSISQQYSLRIGQFDEQKCVKRIQQNKPTMQKFKMLNKIYQGYMIKHKKYLIQIPFQLLMLIQLNILEYRIKMHFPLNLQLKCLNLMLQGLEKRQIIQKFKNR